MSDVITRLSILLRPVGARYFRTSESARESDSDAQDIVVGTCTRLQVNSDISNKLAVWLSRDDVVNMFLYADRVSLNVRDVYPLKTEKNVLTRASLLSPANRNIEACTDSGFWSLPGY